MKYFLILGDGMADRPIEELGGLTPLEKAKTPTFNKLAKKAEFGTVKTVPDHLNPPGSDIANMSVMGYDPDVYYSGRSPLEAVSMGIELGKNDVAIRCNLVTLSDEERYEDATMVDYSAGEISTAESGELISAVNEALGSDRIEFHPGISYRHCLVLRNFPSIDMSFTPPHDISKKKIAGYLPQGSDGKMLFELMKKSREILKNHPVNLKRMAEGKRPASSVWFWGQGRKPGLGNFYEKTGLKGCAVSAVDLVKGLGICAGMEVPSVEGTTGNYDTNFEGKADAAIEFFRNGGDFVYMHVEAPDECGHRHEIGNKVMSIEYIDRRLVKRVIKALDEMGESYRIMVLPDHPTPIEIMTHTHDAVPYMIYDSRKNLSNHRAGARYCEKEGKAAGLYIDKGYTLMDRFLERQ